MSEADEINRLRKSRDYWVRQAMALSEHADNMRLALMEQADVVRREDVVAGRAASAHDLLAALKPCREAMLELAEHQAFEDDAPEFNKGGVGYEACRVAIEAINRAEGRCK